MIKVDLVAETVFDYGLAAEITGAEWNSIAVADGDAMAEYAGRSCYASWGRPNPKTAKNADYIKHIIDSGHLSVLEHASATFYIQGVSRSLTHELVRHRHLQYSMLSQRYVDESETEFVLPPAIEPGSWDHAKMKSAFLKSLEVYRDIVESLQKRGLSRKEARQAARAVLPNATETKIVVTGNFRAWRDMIKQRATAAADVEIRALAVEILRQLKDLSPACFQDMNIVDNTDGTEVLQTQEKI